MLSKKRWPGKGYEVKEIYMDADRVRPDAGELLIHGYPPWACPACGTRLVVELSKIDAHAAYELSQIREAVRFDDLPWE